jgi:hypothetical protein
MSGSFRYRLPSAVVGRMFQQGDQFRRPFAGAVPIQSALASTRRHRRKLASTELKGGERVLCVVRQENFLAGFEEVLDTGPAIAEQWRTAGRRLEQSAGWAPSHLGHRAARDVERQT